MRMRVLALVVVLALVCAVWAAEKCPLKDSASARDLGHHGGLLFEGNQLGQALDCLKKALKKEDKKEKPHRAHLNALIAQVLEKQDEAGEALKYWKDAIALRSPPDVMDHFTYCLLLYRTKNFKDGHTAYTKAIKLFPQIVEFRANFALMLSDMGRREDAIAQLEEALRIKPDFEMAAQSLEILKQGDGQERLNKALEDLGRNPRNPELFSTIASSLLEQNAFPFALRTFRTVLRLDPQDGTGWLGLGNTYERQRILPQAAAYFRKASNYPDVAVQALFNLGTTLNNLNRPDLSIPYFKQCVALSPKEGGAYINYGVALKSMGRLREAETQFRKAIKVSNMPEAYSNLAGLVMSLGKKEEGAELAREAVRLRPDSAQAYNILGASLREVGTHETAVAAFEHSLTLEPGFPDSVMNLADMYLSLTALEDAREVLTRGLGARPQDGPMFCYRFIVHQRLCYWKNHLAEVPRLEEWVDLQVKHGEKPCMQPFQAQIFPVSGEVTLRVTRGYAKLEVDRGEAMLDAPLTVYPPSHMALGPGKRFRVGYICHDFKQHPMSYLAQHMFGLHNREKFEVFGYSTNSGDGSTYERTIRSGIEHFREVYRMSELDQAKTINRDALHVLVDMNGWTMGTNVAVLAMNPSPVQIALGVSYFGTIGTDCVHSLHTTAIISPPDFIPVQYHEKMLYVPPPYQVNDFKFAMPKFLEPAPAIDRTKFGLPANGVVFANFNNLQKLDPRLFDKWLDILYRVPGSALWLLGTPEESKKYLREAATKRGVHEDRLVFCNYEADPNDNLHRMRAADMILDTTFTFNGHTTNADSMWAGVPIVTMPHEKFPTRVGADLASALLPKHGGGMVVLTREEYEARAVLLGLNHKKRKELTEKLRAARKDSDLYNTEKWVHSLERSLVLVYEAALHNDMAVRHHISVAALS